MYESKADAEVGIQDLHGVATVVIVEMIRLHLYPWW
jgi:hypothetical protein